MSNENQDVEELRKTLLTDVYGGAMAGMPALFLDESRIRDADEEELKRIAKEYGYK